MFYQKEGFKGERILSLPENLLHEDSKHPLIAGLYVRKIGFFPKAKYHSINKEKGTDYCMLIYCTNGRGWFSISGKERREILPNEYVILPANIPYTFAADENDPWTIYWLHFKGTLADQFIPYPIIPRPILCSNTSRIQDRIDLFNELYTNFSMAHIKEFMICTSMCLYPFLASFIHIEQYRYHMQKQQKEQEFSVQVIHYMQENITQNLSLTKLAEHFKYSVSRFSSLFLKETGVSPISYFIQLKIQKACQYIELTNLKFYEIANLLGFDEPAYFTRTFTKVMGYPPSEYRQREIGKL